MDSTPCWQLVRSILAARGRSDDQESPGWTVFHLPSTPDGKSNTARPTSGVPRRARRTEAPGAPPVAVLRARRPDLHVPVVALVLHGMPVPVRSVVALVLRGMPVPVMSLMGARSTRLRGAGWGHLSSATTTETELGTTRAGSAPRRGRRSDGRRRPVQDCRLSLARMGVRGDDYGGVSSRRGRTCAAPLS